MEAVSQGSVASPCTTILPARSESHRTICVIGAPRGGTSMIAGILRKLGVFMGDDVDPASNEDREFLVHGGIRKIFLDNTRQSERLSYINHVKSVIKSRNDRYDVRGWKDPISIFYIRDILDMIRNPVFLFITRDPGAIAQRERIEEQVTYRRRLLDYLKVALQAYDQSIDLITERSRPTLLISYERALRAPDQVGRAIARTLGTSVPLGFDEWVAAYIRPDRLDGSIEVDAVGMSSSTKQFGSTRAVEALVEESLRLRREGLIEPALESPDDPGDAAIGVTANRLYEMAAAALGRNGVEQAQNHAVAITSLYTEAFPQLADGPLGILAEELAGGGKSPEYPDVVCGAYYLLGMSHLLRASAQHAIIYFSLAERTMRTRLQQSTPGSILSRANYWNCVLHLGISAKVLQRTTLAAQMKDLILGISVPQGWLSPESVDSPDLERIRQRALIEL
jgi:hypothetical protein